MTRLAETGCVRRLALIVLLAAAPLPAKEADLPKDVAARHPEEKWKIRTADLYRYLVTYYRGQPSAAMVMPEYLKLRLVEDEARRRKVSVSDGEVERWLQALSERMQSQGMGDLDEIRRQMEMGAVELRRRGRQWLLSEKVARAILREKDPSRREDAPVSEDSVILVIDTLYREAPKQADGLPEGVVARIRDVDVTEYEYGRALSFELPFTEVYRAVHQLVLAEEVALLVGDREPPAPGELAVQKEWYIEMEKNRIARMPNAPAVITDDMLEQVLAQRGLSLELVFGNPGFLAQARALGHFQRSLTEERLRAFYEQNRAKYGDQLQVARILVGARGQEVPGVGRPIRPLGHGRKEAEDLWHRLKSGQDFGQLAREHSEDPDVIRLNEGVVPFWITADRPDYADTYEQASALTRGQISKPFFSQGRGYVIVKLLDRKEGLKFEAAKEQVRRDAAEREYNVWRTEVTRAALVNRRLLDRD